MGAHDTHHYIPRFLLQNWHTSEDQKLSCFRWGNGKLIHNRYKAKNAAHEKGLYALKGMDCDQRNALETGFMTPEIDEPAAPVLKQLLETGVNSLTLDQRRDWSTFLIAQRIRTPSSISEIRAKGRATLQAEFEKDPDDYLRARGNNPAGTLSEWVTENDPKLNDDFGLRALPDLVNSPLLVNSLNEATWAIRDVCGARHDLLLGDCPVFYSGTRENKFLMSLPISPRSLFIATNYSSTQLRLASTSNTQLVKLTNETTVHQAKQYVYATSPSQEAFVAKRLRKLVI